MFNFLNKPSLAVLLFIFLPFIITTSCDEEDDDDPFAPPLEFTSFELKYVIDYAIDVSTKPTLSWERVTVLKTDGSLSEEHVDRVRYRITLFLENNDGVYEVGSYSTDRTSFEIPDELKPDTEYFWRVTAFDSQGEINEKNCEAIFHFTTGFDSSNLPPTIPSLLSPENDITNLATENIEFTFDQSTDPDGDPVDYELNVSGNGTKGFVDFYLVTELTTVDNQALMDANFPFSELGEKVECHWSVKARDGKGGLSESETRTFITAGNGSTGESIPASSQVVSTTIRDGSGLEFGGCFGQAMVSHNDKLYDIGGRANENGTWRFGNDVYESSTGVSWTTLKETDDFSDYDFYPSNNHTALSHAGNLYVFSGGQSSVHVSALGEIWTRVDTGSVANETMYENRRNHAAVSMNGNLYVMGGFNGSTNYSDVWESSNDGLAWQKVKESDNSAWKGGEVYAVSFDGAIYLFETRENNQEPAIGIWKSTNGSDWQFLRTVPWTANNEFSVCTYLYGMCVISGDDNNEIWWSEDGMEWSPVELDNPGNLVWRKDHSAVELNGSIYVSYGYGSFTGDSRTDIVKIWFDP